MIKANIVLWNLVILLWSLLLGILLVQHSMFYEFPPNVSRWLDVSPMVYVFLMGAIYMFWKGSSYAEERAKVLPEEN